MAVVFDTSFLIALLDPNAEGDARLSFLLQMLDRSRTTILIPTPALCEVLIGARDTAPEYLRVITGQSRLRVVPFDERAAVEAAAAHRDALRAGDKKEGARSWMKVKFDRQIVAIAKVEGATAIYSNDHDIKRFAARDAIEVISFEELLLPPDVPQRDLFLDDRDEDGG